MRTTVKTRATLRSALLLLALALGGRSAAAFSHLVTKGDSLALIAEKEYGDPRSEEILAFANALDSQGGSAIVPGMRLEVPAPSYHRADGHETWPELARVYLGDERRADLLASVNDAVAWIAPSEGDQIVVPAVVTHLASEGESLVSFARTYWRDPNRAWQLAHYNGRAGDALVLGRGDVILVPLLDVTLTERGKAEAAHAEGKIEHKEHPALLPKDQFALEMDHMAECVLANRKPYTPGEEGLQDQRIMEALYASAASGKPIKLSASGEGTGKLDLFRGESPKEGA